MDPGRRRVTTEETSAASHSKLLGLPETTRERGRAHMREMTDHPWASRVRRIFASDEREAFAPGADPIGLFRGRGLDNLSLAE
jgi:hypothetical protein